MTVRYLHVIPSLDPRWGGPAEGVKQLGAAALRLQHAVEVVTLDRPGTPGTSQTSFPVHCLGPGHLKYGYAPRFVPWLRENVRRFDAVVINGIWQYHSIATWSVLRDTSTPYYVFTHGMLDPWFKRRYPLKHLKKLLYWPLGDYRVLRDAQAVLFTCEEERILARQSFSLYRAREVVVNYGTPGIADGSPEHRRVFLERFPQLAGKRLLLFLGRIHPKKGCDLLIRAFASVARSDAGLHLVIAGPHGEHVQRELEALVKRLGIASAVTWTGMLAGSLKIGAFQCAEVFVLPSHQENFGIAVAEALSCGVPVLISNKVNIWREIVHDQAGLVADDTLAGTRQLLTDWLALGAEDRQRMAHNAYQCFRRRFNIDMAATKLLSLFELQRALHETEAA
jgi:glycosyltransferase involved in cell wall biosynthesis